MTRCFRILATLMVMAAFVAGCSPTATERTAAELAADALERGVVAQNAGNNDAATVAYFEVLQRDSKSAAASRAFYNLGQMARVAGKHAIAEGYYLSSVELDANQAAAWFGLGASRLAQADWAGTADANQKAIALEPNNAAAHFNLALALRQLGRTADAQASFARAQQLDARLTPPPSSSPAR